VFVVALAEAAGAAGAVVVAEGDGASVVVG